MDERPFKQRHRRNPPSMHAEVRDHLHQLLASGVMPYKEKGFVDVNISNITTRTVVIQPRALLCEILPVIVEEQPSVADVSQDKDSLLNKMDIETSHISGTQ